MSLYLAVLIQDIKLFSKVRQKKWESQVNFCIKRTCFYTYCSSCISTVGVLLAVVGYAVGTLGAIITAELMRIVSGG